MEPYYRSLIVTLIDSFKGTLLIIKAKLPTAQKHGSVNLPLVSREWRNGVQF